eukprot:364531-Chlamydomonas_euryale.AAC.6
MSMHKERGTDWQLTVERPSACACPPPIPTPRAFQTSTHMNTVHLQPLPCAGPRKAAQQAELGEARTKKSVDFPITSRVWIFLSRLEARTRTNLALSITSGGTNQDKLGFVHHV